MEFVDIIFVLRWWLMFLIIGIIFLPIANSIFNKFFDRGYIFSKVIGIAIISYAVFVLGVLRIAPFDLVTIAIVSIAFLIINVILIRGLFPMMVVRRHSFEPGRAERTPPKWRLRIAWKIFLFEELLFILTLFFWSFIRAHQPDIHGLEKYMDFGFINSIIRSDYFPPRDMWFTPYSINYYYFGHLVTAVLTKLSVIPSSVTFNLMLSTIFAFTFTASFSIGANLIYLRNTNRAGPRATMQKLFAGLLTGFLVSLAGNLHILFAFFKPYTNENPVPFWQLVFSPDSFPNSYWYPNATRFIHNTIHEFPIYSSVVSDLHGHFLDVPFVLLIIAVLLSLIFNFQFSIFNQIKNLKNSNSFQILIISFLLAVMYMTNAWDGVIYFVFSAFVIFYIKAKLFDNKIYKVGIMNHVLSIMQNKKYIIHTIYYLALILVGFFIFSLPFNINFKPFASSIGVLCSPEFLTNIGKLGPLIFEKDHCEHSPWWQLLILYGFFYFWAISFVIMILGKKNSRFEARNLKQYQNSNVQNSKPSQTWSKRFGNSNFGYLNLFRISDFEFRISPSDGFVLLLITLSTLLIIIPEFIYLKDIYPGHYRANTMFKLVYQAFIMLSIASAYIAVRLISKIQNPKSKIRNKIFNFYYVYLLFAILFFILVAIYPYFAINSYYGELKTYHGLDGLKYLKALYPTDYEAILWINKNIKDQPVILETQGDSYTDYARVSSNTGIPTVLGWTVHEWLWRGSYDIPSPRINDIKTLYETSDITTAKELLKKYNVSLVFIGDLEKQKYPTLDEEKFKTLGKIIYQNGNTKIYKMI